MSGMMHRLHQGLTHKCGGGNGAVKARVMDHLDNGVDAASFFTDQPRPRAVEFDFTGSIGAVPQFVFEPLYVEMIALACGRPTRQEKTREALQGLRQNQERIAHGSGAEPLCPVIKYSPQPPI